MPSTWASAPRNRSTIFPSRFAIFQEARAWVPVATDAPEIFLNLGLAESRLSGASCGPSAGFLHISQRGQPHETSWREARD